MPCVHDPAAGPHLWLGMGLPLAEAAWWAWVAYLHLFFLQQHLSPALLASEPPLSRRLTGKRIKMCLY